MITQGDEIVVQVTKEALKTKEPGAGSALQIGGRYCVVMMEPAGKQPKTKDSFVEKDYRGCIS